MAAEEPEYILFTNLVRIKSLNEKINALHEIGYEVVATAVDDRRPATHHHHHETNVPDAGTGAAVVDREGHPMNDTERKVLKWLYNDIGGRASHVMAYEFLLGDDASRRPDYPYGCHEFNRCLELIRTVPETREGGDQAGRQVPVLGGPRPPLGSARGHAQRGNRRQHGLPPGGTQNNRRPPGPH